MKIPDVVKPYLALIAFLVAVLAGSIAMAKIYIILGIA